MKSIFSTLISIFVLILCLFFTTGKVCAQNIVCPVAMSQQELITDSLISKEEASSITSLSAIFIDNTKVKTFSIYKFEFLTIEGADTTKVLTNGNTLTKAMREKASSLKKNARLIFQGIGSKDKEGTTRALAVLEFKIK